jgi:hypothetical protein
MPRESPFISHVRSLRDLVATAGAPAGAVDAVVISRVRHVLRLLAEAEAKEETADFVDDDSLEGISP